MQPRGKSAWVPSKSRQDAGKLKFEDAFPTIQDASRPHLISSAAALHCSRTDAPDPAQSYAQDQVRAVFHICTLMHDILLQALGCTVLVTCHCQQHLLNSWLLHMVMFPSEVQLRHGMIENAG